MLYCTSQILHFIQIEGLWLSCFMQVCWLHFSNSIVPFVSLTFCSYSTIFKCFSLFFLWWSLISHLWCYHCQKITIHWRLMILFSNKVFFNCICTFFNIMLLPTLSRLQYAVNVTFIFIGKQKIDVVHFIAIIALLQWSGTKPVMSPRYACNSK